jgi:CheY-like chemotaxis protein
MLKLQILLLEANSPDAEATQAALIAGGFDCKLLRADNRADFTSALETREFDVILADCTLPDFDGFTALEIARTLSPDTPLIDRSPGSRSRRIRSQTGIGTLSTLRAASIAGSLGKARSPAHRRDVNRTRATPQVNRLRTPLR